MNVKRRRIVAASAVRTLFEENYAFWSSVVTMDSEVEDAYKDLNELHKTFQWLQRLTGATFEFQTHHVTKKQIRSWKKENTGESE